MQIKELYHDLDLVSFSDRIYIDRSGQRLEQQEQVLIEHEMDIYINEQLTMKLICTPQYLPELVLGRLLSEGIISSTDEVDSIYICEHGTRARVLLKNTEAKTESNYVEVTQSCCTGNHILNDYFVTYPDIAPVTPIEWSPDWIFRMADRFREGMPLHDETWATHSCFLFRGSELLFSCEDIGRHNALDKVVGYALRSGIDLTQCMVYTSGRVPTDMVMKVIRAKIPILCTKAAPSREAISLARMYHVTMIGSARSDRMKLYADGT